MSICINGTARARVRARNGNNSKLYADILEVYDGDRDMALTAYAYVYSDNFKAINGDFESKLYKGKLDENGEPLLDDVVKSLENVYNETEWEDFNSPKRITKDTGKKKTKSDEQRVYDDTEANDIRRAKDLISNKKTLLQETYKQIATLDLKEGREARKEAYRLHKRANEIKKSIDEIDESLDAVALAAIARKDLTRVSNILKQQEPSAADIIYASSVINTWTDPIATFFPESPSSNFLLFGQSDSATHVTDFEGFADIEGYAGALSRRVYAAEKAYLNRALSRETGRDIDINEVFVEQKDFTGIHAHTMSINRSGNPMFESVSNMNHRLMSQAKEEFRDFEKGFDELIKRAIPDLKAMSQHRNPYEIFKEKYADGKETGNIVRQFRPEYDDEAANKFRDTIEDGSEEAWSEYYKWFDDNNILMDWRIMFFDAVDEDGDAVFDNEEGFTNNDRDKLKADIIEIVGEDEFNRLLEKSERDLEDYILTKELAKDDIYNNGRLTEEEKDEQFDQWLSIYSPYQYARVIDTHLPNTNENGVLPAKGHAHTQIIPRKYHKGSVTETGWINEDFDKIRNNRNVYEFYKVMTETIGELNNMLPHHIKKSLSDNSIPAVKRSMMDAWMQDGAKAVKKDMYKNFIGMLTASNTSDLVYSDIDPYTGEVKKNLTINIVKENTKAISNLYSQKLIEWESENGTADTAQKRELKREATDQIVKEKSFDLGEIMKVYYLSTKVYAKKAELEDLVRISDSVFHTTQEVQRTSDGTIKRDMRTGRIAKKSTEKSFQNLKSQWDYWVQYFYGYRSEVEGVGSKKILTKDEKAQVDKIHELSAKLEKQLENGDIDMEDYISKQRKLDSQLIEIGGNLSAGKIGRSLLKYVQLKAMGWNVMSGLANMGFGFVGNITEADYGRIYNRKDFRWAMKKTFNSVLKNYTFNLAETKDAKKIRSISDRFDILSETSNELYQRTYKSKSTKPFDWMKPYNIQNRSEYFNQMPIMLAIMHNTMLDTSKGKIMAYECFNEDGSWNTEEYGSEPKEQVGRMQTKIAVAIARIHGNYNSEMPIAANKKIWMTAAKQFRTWMFEGFADRFEREKESEALGITLKGRYRSGFGIITYAKPKGKEDGSFDIKETVNQTVFTTIQLLRKLTFQNTKFDDRFNETDAANLRKNLSELVVTAGIAGFILLLSMMGGDDDERKRKAKNYTLNLLMRVRLDIWFYVNPNSFEQLTKQSIPAMSLVTDIGSLINAAIDTAHGNGEITRGVYAGQHKLIRGINKNIPFANKIQANRAAMEQLYNNITFAK